MPTLTKEQKLELLEKNLPQIVNLLKQVRTVLRATKKNIEGELLAKEAAQVEALLNELQGKTLH